MQPPSLEQLRAALGPALAFAATAASVARLAGLGRAPRLLLAAVGAACLAVPAGGHFLHEWFRGFTGDLSVVTLLVLAAAACAAAWGKSFLSRRDLSGLAAAGALCGLALYTSAAGLVPWDLYRIGYRPFLLAIAVLAFSLWAWRRGRRGAALAGIVALAAFDLGVLESENLWDYLLDPVGVLCAWGWWLAGGVRSAARRARPEKR